MCNVFLRDELNATVVGAETVVVAHGWELQSISSSSNPEQGIEVVEQALFLLFIPPPHCLLQTVQGPQTLHSAYPVYHTIKRHTYALPPL